MNKSYAILAIYDMLLQKVDFKTENVEIRFNCSRRTAIRYINTVKYYLRKSSSPYKVIYCPTEKSFRLVSKDEK